MIIKRYMLVALSVIVALGIVWSSWAKAAPPLERPKNIKLTIVGFQVGTSMHLRGELIGEALRKEYPDWSIKVVATAKASLDVHRHRQEKTAQFFVSLSPWAAETEAYGPAFRKRGVDFDKVFVWFPVIPSNVKAVHFFVLNKTGLTSVKDIADKKYPLKVGYSYPSHHPLFNRIIEFHGVTWKDIEAWGGRLVKVSFGAPMGPEMMRGGKIEAGFAWTGVPNPPFLRAAADLKWRLLPVAEEDKLLRKTEKIGFTKDIIPAGVYPWEKKDVVTVAQTEWLGAIPGTMPEGVVYWVTKGLWKQREFLIAGFKAFAETLDREFIPSALRALTNTAHPEALKFYREQGWVK